MTQQAELTDIIDVKVAVRAARDQLFTLLETDRLPNLRLEEVKLSDDAKRWLITFGFDTDQPASEQLAMLQSMRILDTPPQFVRVYRIIELDAYTGKFEAMKIATFYD